MINKFKELNVYKLIGLLAIELLILYLLIINLTAIASNIRRFFQIISPFIAGGVIAYLLYKPALGIESFYKKSPIKWVKKRSYSLAVFSVFILLILGVGITLNIALPILVSNIVDFALNLAGYYEEFIRWVNSFNTADLFYGLIPELSDNLMDFVTPEVVAGIGTGALEFASHIMNITSRIFNILLSIIAALYILLTKDSITKLVKRIMRLFMKDATYTKIADYVIKSNGIFYKFVGAQFLDACILGTVATIILVILGVPYAVTFGLLLGICNMIPIFGSIFATIITSLITVFTAGPTLALIVLLALIILQQIDANFIGPKITGDALGLKPLLIIFSIVVGGAYLGIIGMFISVPVAAMIKMFLEDFMDAREKNIHKSKV